LNDGLKSVVFGIVKDDSIVIGCGNDKLWAKMCDLMGAPELITDDRYDKNPKRVAKNIEVKEIVEKWTMTQSAEELVSSMLEAGVPCAPINKQYRTGGKRSSYCRGERNVC